MRKQFHSELNTFTKIIKLRLMVLIAPPQYALQILANPL